MSDGELCTASCDLDEKIFYHCCKLILKHSVVIKDGWSWSSQRSKYETLSKDGVEGYLKKTSLKPGKRSSSLLNYKVKEDTSAWTHEFQLDDEAAEVHTLCDDQIIMHYEYHVLYSCSYQVPVLYFRASTLDGQLLSLEEIWNNIHPNYKQRLLLEPYATLTQQEHPFLGQPFFMLHPCRTKEFMRPILEMALAENRKINYIVTWLSIVGPVVGLDVPCTYNRGVTAHD
ncbi:ubiquitin-like-conjugating enzyme ATG10 [Trichomycterus rosablanca]|uniref:ubiquitin-like-conjugating enzyme ATG10 n=1 Tax=Trichomycterus rosablanca TaxID=2290929 RepID=UPI002F35ADBD